MVGAGAIDDDRVTTLVFSPPAAGQQVRILLVGVPLDDLLDGTEEKWWPFRNACEAVPVGAIVY